MYEKGTKVTGTYQGKKFKGIVDFDPFYEHYFIATEDDQEILFDNDTLEIDE